MEIKQLLSVQTSSMLFTEWYSDLGMSEATGDNAERKVNMQHNAEKIQCNTPLP